MAGRYDARLRLVPGGAGSAIEIGGQQLRGVKSIRLEQGVHELAVLTVDVLLSEVDVESGGTVVRVSEGAAETLVKLGWTPPGHITPQDETAAD